MLHSAQYESIEDGMVFYSDLSDMARGRLLNDLLGMFKLHDVEVSNVAIRECDPDHVDTVTFINSPYGYAIVYYVDTLAKLVVTRVDVAYLDTSDMDVSQELAQITTNWKDLEEGLSLLTKLPSF
jgi:hypothetical protein